MYAELDRVRLKDGRDGFIVYVLEAGVAYLFEYATPHGRHRYEEILVYESDIEGVSGPNVADT